MTDGQPPPRTDHQEISRIVRQWALGRGLNVERMRVTRSAYASRATLLNVHLTLAGGERLRVVHKRGFLGLPIPALMGMEPAIGVEHEREAWMYGSVLPQAAVPAPRLLGAGPQPGGGWLLLEWAGSVDLGQVGSPAVWAEAAAALARVHAWGESQIDRLSQGPLVRWDDYRIHLAWAERARQAGSGVDLTPLWRRYKLVADRMASLPRTLVHGDFNASNVLVTRGPAGDRIRIIDWETAGVGPGLLDLASLTSGRLPEAHRIAVLAAYRANLAGSRLAALSPVEFDQALTWCRLALAVRWMGWSPGWTPPPAHAHDWPEEARRLAGDLGLLETA